MTESITCRVATLAGVAVAVTAAPAAEAAVISDLTSPLPSAVAIAGHIISFPPAPKLVVAPQDNTTSVSTNLLGFGTTVDSSTGFRAAGSAQSYTFYNGANLFFVGLQLQSGADVNYGFLYFENGSSNVFGYAFETQSGVPITTFVPTAAVPEPASLAVLATGAAGVLALRRSRRQRADAAVPVAA